MYQEKATQVNIEDFLVKFPWESYAIWKEKTDDAVNVLNVFFH